MQDLVDRLAGALGVAGAALDRLVVGIDGPDAAGKTTLAERLAAALPDHVARLCADDFLRPREQRYRRGERSPTGYLLDSFDDDVLVPALVAFCGGVAVVAGRAVPSSAVLVIDGVFLQRPALRGLLDLTVYLRVSPQETLRRALARDVDRFGSPAEVERRYRARYLPAQTAYREELDPEGRADILIDNDDVAHPRVVRWLLRDR